MRNELVIVNSLFVFWSSKMKKIYVKDLLKKSVKDLVALRNVLRKELFDNGMKHSYRSLKETHILRLWKKNIARINTAITKSVASV